MDQPFGEAQHQGVSLEPLKEAYWNNGFAKPVTMSLSKIQTSELARTKEQAAL